MTQIRESFHNPTPRTLYETPDFLAVEKPPGLLVHSVAHSKSLAGGKTAHREKEKTLVDWLLARYPDIAGVGDDPVMRPGIVHRLDRDTSGILLVARTQKYFDYLKSLFGHQRVKKTYLAAVRGVPAPPSGTIEKPISLKPGTTKRSVHGGKMTKPAVTEYKTLKFAEDGSASLLSVSPKTGRTHQIRVHLASIGHPVLGDVLYGSRTPKTTFRHLPSAISSLRLMLHAFSIEFESAPGTRLSLEVPISEDFSSALRRFGIPY